MKLRVSLFAAVVLAGAYFYSFSPAALAQSPPTYEELFVTNNKVGHYGGHLVVSLRSEPKTLTPVTSLDVSSREVIAQMTGYLVHINRFTQGKVSSGSDHLWNIGQPHPATAWEAEIDRLMEKQLFTLKPEVRKLLYNRVQEIFAENVPLICLVSPNILVGAKNRVANFKPATLDPYTLWNAQELFFNGKGSPERP